MIRTRMRQLDRHSYRDKTDESVVSNSMTRTSRERQSSPVMPSHQSIASLVLCTLTDNAASTKSFEMSLSMKNLF
ncbi:hypothetical protein HBI56_086970 [Parastagonospora nodorum]|uniref:Uncharacterized protein n=1 Tax=Phaeosphaeria nodorum (strain SN15 / ATCC MYA-4574 / FGSC 10173) TaxID=321614 RepID=A0A7U2FE89_PHANO|nr:hypothetical protein HBH56_112520 [Parastagonospora nodorum]QRD03508.1 hypothetical protein JI435_419640 [Parastagonospora nodorum SN15]KAH3925449.1 hypothetical protein HBH54_177830 [Parastagonospora nodorum]KAH3974361.1 hypothetical protein HBH51_090040 [Parastagonospora nodorum]KAH3979329.1 hypothetical protein HBH52_098040 [Parastagonospora nodorum]